MYNDPLWLARGTSRRIPPLISSPPSIRILTSDMVIESAAPGPAVGWRPSSSTTVFVNVVVPAGTSLYDVDLWVNDPDGPRFEVGGLTESDDRRDALNWCEGCLGEHVSAHVSGHTNSP